LVATVAVVTGAPTFAGVVGSTPATGPSVAGDGGWAHAAIAPGAAWPQGASVPAISPPSGYPVRGIGVSAFDHDAGKPPLVWPDQAAAGLKFAYVKATEGTSYVNPHYGTDVSGAKAAGLYAGAYAFGRPDLTNPVGQADYFVNHMQWSRDGKTLPPFLDIEWPYFAGVQACYNLSTTQMVSWIGSFVSELRARIGVTPMIYTNVNWWNPCTGNNGSFGNYLLDIASCTNSPPSLPGWGTRWTFLAVRHPGLGLRRLGRSRLRRVQRLAHRPGRPGWASGRSRRAPGAGRFGPVDRLRAAVRGRRGAVLRRPGGDGCRHPDGSPQVVAIGNDGLLYSTLRRPDGMWTGWSRLPGANGAAVFAASDVSIANTAAGTAQVLAIGNDGMDYPILHRADGSWTSWVALPGANRAAPLRRPGSGPWPAVRIPDVGQRTHRIDGGWRVPLRGSAHPRSTRGTRL
jgi:GH25 family lysozyme M1 (1,4-beta-N-acetylmuramidase)